MDHLYILRTMCDVLEDIRTCNKTKNYSYLDGLVEEAQHFANKMEAKLGTIKDLQHVEEELKGLSREFKGLNNELKGLDKELKDKKKKKQDKEG